jgi:hypothetical protein
MINNILCFKPFFSRLISLETLYINNYSQIEDFRAYPKINLL